MTDDDTSQPRRAFFREGLARALEPLANMLETKLPAIPQAFLPFLRPPGAITEDAFLSTCQRCGQCVAACPADAILWLNYPNNEQLHHTPIIKPSEAACVICEGLQCTQTCPSGALLPLTRPEEIRMGTAMVDEAACLRQRGQACTTCVDLCPIGEIALRFVNEEPPQVLPDGCVGCGVCQQQCPTSPKAIVVLPH